MNRERTDLWCERGMLGSVLGILVFGPLAAGAVHQINFLIIQCLALLLIPLWLIRLWLFRDRNIFWPPVCWVALVFVAYAVGRYLTADLEWVARQELIHILVYALVFFTLVVFLNSSEHTKVICLTLVFVGMGVAMYAIYQYVAESDRVWHLVSPYKIRGKGTYINPNHLAGFLEMLVPVGFAFTLTSRLKTATKIFVGYASLVMLAGIGVSLSRGSWIASAVALMFFFFVLILRRQFWLQGILVLLVVSCAAGLFTRQNYGVKKRFERILMKGRPADNRFELWKPAYQMWRENFWFGVGPNHYDFRFRAYRPQVVQTQPDHTHNDYLNTLADWGTTGAALVSSAVGLVLAGAFLTMRNLKHVAADLGSGRSNKFAVVLGTGAGMVAALIHAVVEFNMQIPANAILFIALLAMASGHLRFVTGRLRFVCAGFSRWMLSLMLVALLSFLAFQECKGVRECFWLRRARDNYMYSQVQLENLKRAFRAEPANFQTTHWIGECYRAQSMEGFEDYSERGEQAISWFQMSERLNPFDGNIWLHHAMCLDWMERFDESKTLYIKALSCDPNGSHTIAMMGWHYLQLGKFAAAEPWFRRSKMLLPDGNRMADGYLEVIQRRLEENARENESLIQLPRGP